jgi:hypothetical protein
MNSNRHFFHLTKSLFFGLLFFCALTSQSLSAAIFVVNTTADSGVGSLRQALINSNATPGLNIINFAIPNPGPFTIQPLTQLPTITNPVFIDGYTQAGSSVNTLPLSQGTNAILMITINGSNYTIGNGVNSGVGLLLGPGSDGSTIRGLNFNEWILAGIAVSESSGNRFLGNFIGTNLSGTVQNANKTGILIIQGDSNQIGTFNVEDRNLIGGSFSDFLGGAGVTIAGGFGNSIQGNIIGLNRSGNEVLGNSVNGVFVSSLTLNDGTIVQANGTLIGGTLPETGNVISGQTIYGININSGINSTITGNLIGSDSTGTVALGNLNAGIALSAQSGPAVSNTISENVISGNGQGIVLGSLFFNFGTNFNLITRNLIGTDITGTKALGNTENGIWVLDSNNIIGGSFLAQEGNVISANGGNGVLITSMASATLVLGNLIGTDITGIAALGNGQNGIQLGTGGGNNAAISNQIGGTLAGVENVISGNLQNGIKIQSFSTGNVVEGNLIGTDITGLLPLPNIEQGVLITSSFGNTIGGNALDAGNIIAYNRSGVMVGADAEDEDSINNVILSNAIFANITLGIDLHKRGAPQKLAQTFKGPNHFQTSPEICFAAVVDAISLEVTGKLHSAAFTNYEIQFFANENANSGQGMVFLSSLIVTTNSRGKVSFAKSMVPFLPNHYITATATRLDVDGTPLETSEFSHSKKIFFKS